VSVVLGLLALLATLCFAAVALPICVVVGYEIGMEVAEAIYMWRRGHD